MSGEDGDDYLSGDAGDDELIGGSGNDQLEGGDGNDLIYGGIGDDILSGDAGDDHLDGGEGNDLLFGSDGNDIFIASAGNDELLGGTGTDIVSFIDNFSSITVDLTAGTASSADGNSRLGNIENVRGSTGDDSIKGDGSHNVLSGEAGNDLFQDWLGSNTILGGEGSDTISYANFSTESLLSPIVTIDLVANFSRTEIYVYLYDPAASPDERSTFSENTLNSIENATGSNLNDFIYGSAEKNRLEGLDGDDLMQGGWGDDIISGGDGVDTLSFSYLESNHRLTVSLSSFTSNTFDFDSGKILETDEIFAIENLIGGSGNDQIEGNHSDNYLVGGLGSDTLYGFDGNDYLTGDDDDDVLSGGAGDDRLFGGDGNDILISGSGNDELQGGLGRDTASFIDAFSSVTVDLEAGTASGADGIRILGSIEDVRGSAGDDFIRGDATDNVLSGEDGNDIFQDWQGFNTIEGGDGEDTISYKDVSFGLLSFWRSPVITINLAENFSRLQAFDIFDFSGANPRERSTLSQNSLDSVENAVGSHFVDFIVGNSHRNKIDGLSGDDLISGGYGDDIIDGGDGIDTLHFNYLGVNQRVTISLLENSSSTFNDLGITIETDEIRGIENVIGSSGNDEISGNNDNNYLDGGSGWNVLYGLGGNDTLVGGTGGSYIDGGADSDTVDYRFASVGLVGSLEAQYVTVGSYVDTLFSIENIIGSEFGDELLGDSQGNRIDGRGGRDTLYGLDGKDTLNGGDDNDQLFGDADDDELIGGSGSDQLFGGSGDDWLKGGQGDDRLVGEAGDDWLADSEGFDRFEGGDGTDYADFSEAKTGIFASLSEGRAENIRNNNEESIFHAILNSIENLQGGDRDDILEGDNKINVLNGGGGADTVSYKYLATGHSVDANLITGQASVKDRDSLIFDTDILVLIENLTGSSGNDTLTGNDQDNILIGGDGADSLSGGGGNDVIYAEVKKDLLIDGGDGNDTLHIVFSSSSTELLSNFFFLNGLSGFTNFENLIGSYASEYLRGDVKDNLIDGGLGNDEIYGRGGNDILKGGDGINIIIGGTGHNIIDGTSSLNSNSMSFAAYEISESLIIDLRLEKGNAQLASRDTAAFTLVDDYINILSVRSGIGNDFMTGNSQSNILNGSFGDDQIFSMGGDDFLDGGQGSDILEGGTGSDIFVFKDYRSLASDPGKDIDTIIDFGFGGNDKIDLRSFGVLGDNNFQITNTANSSTVSIQGTNFTQEIIVNGPLAGSLTLDNHFLFSGFNNSQTSFYDGVTGILGLY